MRRLTLLAIAVSVLLTCGCASLERSRLKAAIQGQRSESLVRAESRGQLMRLANEQSQLQAQRNDWRWLELCRRHEYRKHWRCRQHTTTDGGLDRIEVTGSRIAAADIITNNQEQGVDEGDIVKKLGSRLYVLRQGQLHTIEIGSAAHPKLELVDSLVVSTDDESDHTWYDEILTAGNHLILLGFNWHRSIAELSVFEAHAGGLDHRSRFWVRTSDYFSGSNYGSRIEGEHLLMTVSIPLDDIDVSWPEWARVVDSAAEGLQWQALIEPEAVRLPLVGMPQSPHVHAVARCALSALGQGVLDCQSSGVVGSERTQFYASTEAAYLSIAEWDDSAWLDPEFNPSRWWSLGDAELPIDSALRTFVYRFPYRDLGAVQVATLRGAIGSQFSMRDDGVGLWVATRDDHSGAAFVLLQRLDWALFGDRVETLAAEVARVPVDEEHRTLRFAGDALWVGEHGRAIAEQEVPKSHTRLLRVPLDGGGPGALELPHSADMIEPLGDLVLVSGNGEGLQWTLSMVGGDAAMPLLGRVEPPAQVVAEARSHAFNARPWHTGWLFGVPVVAPREDAWEQFQQVSDLALFSTTAGLQQLARVNMQQSVPCDEHCYDFYGNARLFFVGERIFALSGGVLKELSLTGGVVQEESRLDF